MMKQIKDTKSTFPCKQNIILVLEPGKSLPIRFRRNILQSDLSETVLPIQFPLVATNSRELEQLLNVLHFLISIPQFGIEMKNYWFVNNWASCNSNTFLSKVHFNKKYYF